LPQPNPNALAKYQEVKQEDIISYVRENWTRAALAVNQRFNDPDVQRFLRTEAIKRIEENWDRWGNGEWIKAITVEDYERTVADVLLRELLEELTDAVVYELIGMSNNARSMKFPSAIPGRYSEGKTGRRYDDGEWEPDF
jgi:hypothetical protein